MNILHLQLSGNPGGIVSLCRTIASNSSNVNYMYFLMSGGSVADQMKDAGIPVVVSKCDRYLWRKSIHDFIDFIDNHKIDVIVNHSNSPIACAHVLAVKRKKKNVKLLMYLHGAAEDMYPHNYKKRIYLSYIKRTAKRADEIVAISHYVKTSCAQAFNISESRITVIYNGVDCLKFTPKNRPYRADDVLKLIYVGRVFKKKGLDLLVKAVALLPSDTNISVTVVGTGPELSNLQLLSKELGIEDKISFLGLRMDIPNLLKEADFFVHPAVWNEGFGITLIESLATGLPCIAFNRGAIPEIIEDGKNGYLLQTVSDTELAQKIMFCYNDLDNLKYSAMSDYAIKSVHKFDILNKVRELEMLYG